MRGNGRVICTMVLALLSRAADAGINGFHKWFGGKFGSAVTLTEPWQSDDFDHVCFDMNQILHVCLRKATDEGDAISSIFREIHILLKQCKPEKSVVFAFDGSAPVAKMIVQRKRREDERKVDPRYGMSSLQISPGTDFMERVASAMEYFAYRQCQQRGFSKVKFYISGANVPGEGELKCIDWVKLTSQAGTEESTIFIGGDADLVLQGMALSRVKNLFVYNQASKRKGRVSSLWEVVRSLEKLFPGQSEYLRADLMLLMVLNGNDYLPKVRGISFGACFRAYLDIKQRGEDSHKEHFCFVDGSTRTFDWEFLAEFFSILSGHSYVPSTAVQDKLNKYPPAAMLFDQAVGQGRLGSRQRVEINVEPIGDNTTLSLSSEERQWRSSATVDGQHYSWVHATTTKKKAKHVAAATLLKQLLPDVYEKHLKLEAARRLEEELDSEPCGTEGEECTAWENGDREARDRNSSLYSVEAYLTGLLWNLQMYVDGYTPDFYWQYGLPYAPSCAEIVEWVKGHPEKLACIVPPVSRAPPMPSGVACLCLMPLTEMGRKYLPPRLKPLVEPGNPVLEALRFMEPSTGVNLAKLFEAVLSEAPEELAQFSSSHASEAWKVMFFDSSEDSSVYASPSPPQPPGRDFPTLQRNGNVRVTSMAGTGSPPCDPWCNPNDPSTHQQPQSVLSERYKKAFVRTADQRRGRSYGGHRSHEGQRVRGEGAGRSQAPRSVAWRKTISASKLRRRHQPTGGGRETADKTNDAPKPDFSMRHTRTVRKVETRVPFSGVSCGRGVSMPFSRPAFGKMKSCRLRI